MLDYCTGLGWSSFWRWPRLEWKTSTQVWHLDSVDRISEQPAYPNYCLSYLRAAPTFGEDVIGSCVSSQHNPRDRLCTITLSRDVKKCPLYRAVHSILTLCYRFKLWPAVKRSFDLPNYSMKEYLAQFLRLRHLSASCCSPEQRL